MAHSFARLQEGIRSHDARTVCELVYPIGQASSFSALQTLLQQPAQADRLHAYINQCTRDFGRKRSHFVEFQRLFGGLSLHGATIHGSLAEAHVTSNRGRVDLPFGRVLNEWRLLFGTG